VPDSAPVDSPVWRHLFLKWDERETAPRQVFFSPAASPLALFHACDTSGFGRLKIGLSLEWETSKDAQEH